MHIHTLTPPTTQWGGTDADHQRIAARRGERRSAPRALRTRALSARRGRDAELGRCRVWIRTAHLPRAVHGPRDGLDRDRVGPGRVRRFPGAGRARTGDHPRGDLSVWTRDVGVLIIIILSFFGWGTPWHGR